MSIVDKILAIVFFVLLCVSLGGNIFQHWNNKTLTTDNSNLQTKLTNTETRLKNETDRYNRLLSQVKAADAKSKEDQQQINDLQKNIKENKDKANAEIAALKKQKTPKTYEEILQFMTDNIQNVTKGY